MGKSLGFTREEFSVICDAFEIWQLVCFDEQEDENSQESKEKDTYNQILFELYKKEYIMLEGEQFVVSDEVKTIFSILKKCENVVTVSTKDENVPGYCIYFSKEERFVLMRYGNRKGEYVKIELMDKEDFFIFLKDSEVLLPEISWEDVVEKRVDRDVIGEQLRTFLEIGNLAEAEQMWDIPQVSSLFRIFNPRTGKKKGYFAIVKQPIQDRIIAVNEENIEMFSYSQQKILELFQKIQENENGIGRCDCSQCE